MTLLKIINKDARQHCQYCHGLRPLHVTILTQRVINTMSIGYTFRTKNSFLMTLINAIASNYKFACFGSR